ncbi:MAG: Trp biosynthesis-associated membrane protein [Arthrobacter sp.]|uniref:Trp biosynthesis-associated membrane protein n=1 Tax=Arthrobacter sp. AOP36-A1-22 TaxID=3457684 RepID=UPI002650B5A5|nr:Trp biosynthesis-associated membrane protein [Micrococcaceae bacterium]
MSQTNTPTSDQEPERKVIGRWMSKRMVVSAGVIGAIAALAMSTRTWVRVIPSSGAINVQPFDVSGDDAATAVAALAVVVLAGSVAAAIAGRMARWIIAVLILLSGLGIAASAISALSDPVAASVSTVGAAAGTLRVNGDYQLTFWPWLTVVIGVWIMATAVWLAVAGHRWKTSRKYTPAPATQAVATPVADTVAGDAAPATAQRPGSGAPTSSEEQPEDEESMDEIDGWDSLTRGEDPTG